MSREQTVRDVAYAIWEAEGKPQGRDAAHWQQAEARVAASLSGGKPPATKKPAFKKADGKAVVSETVEAKAKPPAKGRPVPSAKEAPAAKPPAKAAATKAAPKKKA